ncbi:hypothetical protein GCM10020254_15180 [Streptomyces goshikiensis]
MDRRPGDGQGGRGGERAAQAPGESWAVYVEYQTNVYAITTSDFWGNYSTEFVNVTQPTGVVAGRAC